jgi:hypothetical protein
MIGRNLKEVKLVKRMGGACRMCGRDEGCIKPLYLGNLKG